jgi:hypothetical protein
LEKKPKSVGEKGQIEVWVLNLLSGPTVRSIELEAAQKIELQDRALQEELAKALGALSQARDQDKKPVTVNFIGEGQRHVRLGYVVETPIWKTSYRLILSDDAKVSPKLQGWAIVENQTDNDWDNVELSLVSGRPISFIQDLYQPLYIPRPVVKPELYASLRPQTYEGGIKNEEEAAKFGPEDAVEKAAGAAGGGSAAGGAGARGGGGGLFALGGAVERRPLDATASVAAMASTGRVGELFQYTVGNVSLARQRSAMIPIITDAIEAERVSIYNQDVLQRNPLNGARIKNSTQKHLLAGPITVLDGNGYAGDASIDNLPPGQERLISYGVDLEVVVDANNVTQEDAIESGKIVKGVLWVAHKNVFTQEYVLENKGDKDKTIIIEHPRRDGWNLVDGEKPMETTDEVYRFREKVAAGQSSKITVREQIVQDQEFAILAGDVGQFEVFRKAATIPQKVRDALAKVVGMKTTLGETQTQVQSKEQRVEQITQGQNRIRENMKTVAQNSAYYARLLGKLNDEETALEKLQEEIGTLQAMQEQQRKELESYVMQLAIE